MKKNIGEQYVKQGYEGMQMEMKDQQYGIIRFISHSGIFAAMIFFLTGLGGYAQERVTTFGFQFRPMISGELVNETDPGDVVPDTSSLSVNKLYGYSAGMVIRKGIRKNFSIETGINFTKRNFKQTIRDETTGFEGSANYSIIAYEVPIKGLIYIRLNKEIFMNAAFGMSFDMYPSDVALKEDYFIMEGRRRSWIQPALIANLGWEYRTEKNGTFYIGGAYHRNFRTFYSTLVQLDNKVFTKKMFTYLDGNYLTIDLRYFFHEDPEKKKRRREKRFKQRR